MPPRDSHIDQAEHNHEFWNSLNRTNYPDWVIIGMFYEAVHWIEAQLAVLGYHSRSHNQRATNLVDPSFSGVPNLIRDYGILRVESENVRYFAHKSTVSQVTSLRPIAERIRLGMQTLLGISP